MTDERKKKAVKVALNLLYPLISIALMLTVWAIAAAAIGEPLILPSIGETFRALFNLAGRGYFWRSFFASVGRALVAFICSLVIAAALVTLGKICPPLEKIISPIVTFLRAVPTMSVIFLLIIWVGPSFAPPFTTLLIIMPTTYSAIKSAVEGVDKNLLDMAKVYGVSRKKAVGKIVVPATLPPIVEASAGAMTLCVKLVIAAEVLSLTAYSLGGIMQASNVTLATARLAAVTAAAVALCYLLEFLIRLPLKIIGKKRRLG